MSPSTPRSLLRLAFAAPMLAASLGAQGALPLEGTYAFSEIQGEHGHPCGGALGGNLIASQSGTFTFAPDGGYSFVVVEHGVCETGTLVPAGGSDTGAYTVEVDGTVTLDPTSSDPFHSWIRPDLEVWVGASDIAGGPSLLVGTRLASGLGDRLLSGPYHFAKLALANTGSGTTGETWSGTLVFDGAGSVTGTYTRKSVDATGGTIVQTGQTLAWSYSVAASGTLVLDGMAGGVTAAGDLLHASDTAGQEVALFVAVPATSGATAELFGGDWGFSDSLTLLGSDALLPAFCSSRQDAVVDASTASFVLGGSEICVTPSTETVQVVGGAGTYAVHPDGAVVVSTGQPGALDPDGTLGFLVDADAAFAGEVSLALLLRKGELPQPYGTPTPGTGGVSPTLSSAGFAVLGDAGFALHVEQGLAGAPAFLGVSTFASAGLPALGGIVWLDPGTLFLVQTASLSSSGDASFSLPVPAMPTLDGATFHAQALVVDAGAAGGFAMTAGLAIPVQR